MDNRCVGNSAAMNRLFVAAARRGERVGALARLGLAGGRRTVAPPTSGAGQPTATQLFAAAMVASRVQRAQREAEPEQKIISNNF
jgi:hypothetical protein